MRQWIYIYVFLYCQRQLYIQYFAVVFIEFAVVFIEFVIFVLILLHLIFSLISFGRESIHEARCIHAFH